MSISKNPQAMSLAFKKCKGKIMKIKELEITPDMDDDTTEALIELLAESKAADDTEGKSTVADHVKGQRWYVEGLVKFSALTPEEQLDAEYQDAFADSASEDEMLQSLRAMSV